MFLAFQDFTIVHTLIYMPYTARMDVNCLLDGRILAPDMGKLRVAVWRSHECAFNTMLLANLILFCMSFSWHLLSYGSLAIYPMSWVLSGQSSSLR
jgi:hypothetical protein